ncbi:hypothetical protein DPEC_G00353900 [Dallia pectoralis]|uniref:Uncharacterized protein n=1 Tax=Dallia pectoralis TaxID=75939 RepID=A0ACC2F2T1_DALPE|nr:hypothetical protein DPEC_G00353900 [Dallia pectoralis]
MSCKIQEFMEATQLIDDSILEDKEENVESRNNKQRQPLAKLKVLKNEHIPETELLLYHGENVMGRDPDSCSQTLLARSVSKQHAVISISVFRDKRRPGNSDATETEALVWDLGSMNGTRKGRTKLTSHVRYALTEGECLVLADIPCQYVSVDKKGGLEDRCPTTRDSSRLVGSEPDNRKAQLRESPSRWSHGLRQEAGTTMRQGRGVIGELEAKTPSRTKPLAFEQTPTQPEKTLVPESESDSDEERDGRKDKLSSKFLSPTSDVIPESEDESPITFSSAKNTPDKGVSISEEERDMDKPRRKPRTTRARMILDDSEEEDETEDKEAPGEKARGAQDVSFEVAERVGPVDRDGWPGSGPISSTESRAVLIMDSDTDVEGDEEDMLFAAVSCVQPAPTTPPERGIFHMDSDTDTEEGLDRGSMLTLAGAERDRRPVDEVPQTDPKPDGDTDVDAAAMVTSSLSNHDQTPDTSAVEVVELHLDSDTDPEEDANPSESGSCGFRTAEAGRHNVIADTEDLPISSASSITAEIHHPQFTVEPAAALEIRSDSDTEPEEDTTPPTPLAQTTSPDAHTKVASLRSRDREADTDIEEEGSGFKVEVVPESDVSEPCDSRMDSDTDVEEGEGGAEDTGSQQKCSTPFASSVVELETQEFFSPEDPFRRPALPPASRPSLYLQSSSSASDSQKDEDFAVAETQSFVLEHQSSMDPILESTPLYHLQPDQHSFQLGRSDSSPRAEDQALYPPEGELEATQDYGPVAPVPVPTSRPWAREGTHAVSIAHGDYDLEPTQEFGSAGDGEEPDRGQRSALPSGDKREDFALEATQAYADPTCSDLEEEDTQAWVAIAETLPMSVEEEEEEAMPATLLRGGEEQVTQPGAMLTDHYLATAQTLDMVQDVESEEEQKETEVDSTGGRGRSQQHPVDDDDDVALRRSLGGKEEEFPTSSHISTAETLPMFIADDDDDDEEEDKQDSREKSSPIKGAADLTSCDPGGDEVEGSEPPRRQTRGTRKALMSLIGGRRQKVSSEEEEEAAVVEQERKRRGINSVKVEERKLKDDREKHDQMERERKERETMEREEKERVEREEKRVERETMERVERETMERVERETMERVERETKERVERETMEREEKERVEREEKERVERETMEREEKERVEREEKERVERETMERVERETMEREEKERVERETMEREEKERVEREEKERVEREEKDRVERETMEREEKERVERETMEREEKERVERETMEKEEKERVERERIEKERLVKEKRRNKKLFDLDIKTRDLKEKQEHKTEDGTMQGGEHEVGERLKMEPVEEIENQEANKEPETQRERRVSTRGVSAVPPKPDRNQDVPCSDPEPVLFSKTRSRSNSVSSERSTSSVGTQGTRGRGRGRGGRKASTTTTTELVSDTPTRSSTRRRTVAVPAVAPSAVLEVTVQDILSSEEAVARRTRSRSSSTGSLKSDVSTTSVASVTSQSRGRRTKEEDHAPERELEENVGATRGRRRTAKSSKSGPVSVEEETLTAQITENCLPAGGRLRGRRQIPPEPPTAPPGEGEASKTARRPKKRELEEEEDPREFKVPPVKAQRGARRGAAEETKDMEKSVSPPVKIGRASTSQRKGIAVGDTTQEGRRKKPGEAGSVQEKVPARQSVAPKKVQTKDVSPSSMDKCSEVQVSQTPTGKGRGKRSSSGNLSTVAKTPRSSSVSPLSSVSPGTLSRSRAASNTCKVLFTGLVDEEGEEVVFHLGGSLAKGVSDMTHLVTDKVRRTVKFLCAVARGVPIITTDWLDKCGKAGSFLSTDRFLVKDRDQERKFSFCLEESLKAASTQQLLQGYQVHVTRSVQPEPAQMKDIITCSGARFLSKMPSVEKPHTVVISCVEDWPLCAPALSASLPVVTAEFLLTGILQQRVDLLTHILSAPKPLTQPGGRGRNRT